MNSDHRTTTASDLDYRTCLKCQQTKHVSCFSTYTAGGLNRWCVVCVAASEAQSHRKGASERNTRGR